MFKYKQFLSGIMEIKIDKIGSKNYYAEVLSVMSNYKKLADNPRQKIRGITSQAIILTAVSFVFLAVFTALYLQDMSNSLYFYVVVIFAAAFVLGIVYYLMINRRISQLKDVDLDKKLIIESDYVEMVIGDEKTRLEMSEIQYVIINRYSISFLPKNADSKMIAIDRNYRDLVVKEIADKNLIVDNSDLY